MRTLFLTSSGLNEKTMVLFDLTLARRKFHYYRSLPRGGPAPLAALVVFAPSFTASNKSPPNRLEKRSWRTRRPAPCTLPAQVC